MEGSNRAGGHAQRGGQEGTREWLRQQVAQCAHENEAAASDAHGADGDEERDAGAAGSDGS